MRESLYIINNRELNRFDNFFRGFFDGTEYDDFIQECIYENRACFGVALGACCFMIVLALNRNIKQSNASFFSSVIFNFTILLTAWAVVILAEPVSKGQGSEYLMSFFIMVGLILAKKIIPILIDRSYSKIGDPNVQLQNPCSLERQKFDKKSSVKIPQLPKTISKRMKPPPPPPSEAAIASFHFAAFQGDLVVLKTFLRQKNIINTQNNGLTALHQAISGLQVAAVDCLIKAGHDVNIFSLNKLTPVHVACIEGSLVIVKMLVENGADIFALGTDEYSCAHMVVARGHHEILDFLLTKGISLYYKTSRDLSPIDLVKSSKSGALKSLIKSRIIQNADAIINEIVAIFTSQKLPIEIVHQILSFLVDFKSRKDFTSLNPSPSAPFIELTEAEKRTIFSVPISDIFSYL